MLKKEMLVNIHWEALGTEETLERLYTGRNGLSGKEAQARLSEYGENKLPEEKTPGFIRRFLSQFNNALIYVLLAATVLTAVMEHWIDTWVILGVVLINAVIGYIQEDKARKALEGIRHMLSLKASVIRDGLRSEIMAEQLVPGDIVLLAAGDKIPADIRILEASGFQVEESSLTGESEAVDKNPEAVPKGTVLGDRYSMAYTGTTVRAGSATGAVVATAAYTELGKINRMLSETESMTTPLIQNINRFGKILSVLIVLLAAAVFFYGWLMQKYEVQDMILAVIGLAVAAIPEGLPAIMTVTLAIGVQRMAGRNAIVRKLPSVETLGSVTVICSDKTGTLTRNEMTVKSVCTAQALYQVEGAGYDPDGIIHLDGLKPDLEADPALGRMMQTVDLCNDAEIAKNEKGIWEVRGAPTEGALKVLAIKSGIRGEQARLLHKIPFDSRYKYRATLHSAGGEHVIFVNGAPERLLMMCETQLTQQGNLPLDKEYWEKQIENGAEKGYRMLGSAYRIVDAGTSVIGHDDLQSNLVFIGLTGLIDPPRPEAVEAIRVCKEAGITVKMITGDHAVTAKTIGAQMGIGDGRTVVVGAELEEASDEELRSMVKTCDIFARTSPEHKLRLVSALQANGEVCAMTGDGVNDAPALKKADIGIAMGIKGTEVTKDSAAMVLADDNFASIASAVEEGRTIYDNLRKTLLFMLPTNGAEALVILAAIVLGLTMPITPVQILWVNMVTAVTLGIALAFEPMETSAMKRPPRSPKEPIVNLYFVFRIILVSMVIGGVTLFAFNTLKQQGYSLQLAQTIAINTLVAGELFYLFNCRKLDRFALGKDIIENRAVIFTGAALVVIQAMFTYVPFMQILFGTQSMALRHWVFPAVGGAAVFVTVELEKLISGKIRKRR